MLFLVAKTHRKYRSTTTYQRYIRALLVDKRFAPPGQQDVTSPQEDGVLRRSPEEFLQQGVIPLTALDQIQWNSRVLFDDEKTGAGVISKRHGLTELTGRLYMRGKNVGPAVKLLLYWVYALEPKSGKYLLTEARLEEGSTHDIVDEKGKETPLKAALFTIRKALGNKPLTEPPQPLRTFASTLVYGGHTYEEFVL